MNGRERFASAVLVITVAIGVLASVLDQEGRGVHLPGPVRETSDSCAQSSHAYLRLNINSATAEELMALPGIGPARAGAIVDWRNRHGPFERVEDLVAVKGIGKKTLDDIRAFICVNGRGSPARE